MPATPAARWTRRALEALLAAPFALGERAAAPAGLEDAVAHCRQLGPPSVADAAARLCALRIDPVPAAGRRPPVVHQYFDAVSSVTTRSRGRWESPSRDEPDMWISRPDGCTARQEVPARDGKNVQDEPGSCQPASGSWYFVYDSTTVTEVVKATVEGRQRSGRPTAAEKSAQ
ncbi:hypothetical protein [Streptomyces sp. MMG1121]|uniref:hypothetical protein n=1 Tax=Streptomyces sp. MMG1121 TaxID=1415544 RepID=UPI00131CA923|nr:hypothetical protein [Streptomyces sp. MMG1121]